VQAESPTLFLEQKLRDELRKKPEYTDDGILVPGQS
jgi:hypothetical protein